MGAWPTTRRLIAAGGLGRQAASCVLLWVVVAGAFVLFQDNFIGTSLTQAIPYAVVVVGMVLQIGYGRQIALSQLVFMAFGAYGVAVLNINMAIPAALAIAIVTVVSVGLGLIIALLVGRVGGLAVGLITLFLVVMLSDSIIYSSYLGGTTGMGPVSSIFPSASASTGEVETGVVAAAVLALATLCVVRILKDDAGTEISLIGASGRAAASVGIRASRRRVEVFVAGAVLATMGGGLFAALQGFVSPTEFDPATELTVLLMLFLGGQTAIYCAVVGPFLIEALPGVSSVVANNITLIEGVLFTVLLILLPMGIGGLCQSLAQRISGAPSASNPASVGVGFIRTRLAAAVAGAGGLSTGEAGGDPGGRTAPAVVAVGAAAAGLVTVKPAPAAAGLASQPGTAGPEGPRGPAARVAGGVRQASDPLARPGSGSAGNGPAPPVVRARGLTKSFGGVAAVREVSFDIDGPGVYCVVGPNGAGKSTLMELLSGGRSPDRGSVEFGGQDVTSVPSWRRARMGVGRTFQNVELSSSLSPLDNVAVAAVRRRRGILRPVFKSVMTEGRAQALEVMKMLDIADIADLPLHRLTLAQERSVELARTLVGGPRLLLLDEPASGLSEDQRELFASVLTRIGERLPIILVEHDLALVTKVAKVVIVLVEGEVVYEGDVQGFEVDPSVRKHLRGLVS